MKRLACLGALAILSLAPAAVLADGLPVAPVLRLEPPAPAPAAPTDPILAYAAHELTDATHALAQILSSARGPEDRVYEEAVSLHDAAEHFEEEVMRGPDDLDADYRAVERSYDDLSDQIRTAPSVEENPEAKSAWKTLSDANVRLRLSWTAHVFASLLPHHGHPVAHPDGPPLPPR